MIEIEGYKAFRGEMKITPLSIFHDPFVLKGDFLYKPDTGCWYYNGRSYEAEICNVQRDDMEDSNDAE